MPTFYSDPITSTTNSTYTTSVFNGWITTGATATTATIWTSWIDVTGTSSTTAISAPYYEPPPLTPEQRAEQTAQNARYALEREQLRRESRRAKRRALLTMLRFITDQQRAEFKERGYFHVQGGATGQRYRINRGRIANIDVVDAAGKVLRRLCAHPALDVPDCDTMLAQALHLQSAANEEQFVSIANVRHVQ